MANTVPITEKTIANEIKTNAYLLGTQPNTQGKDALFRFPISMLISTINVELKNRVLFDTTLTQNARTVFIDKDLSGAYLNLSEYSVFFFGKITPNIAFYLNSFYTLAGKQYLTCYSGAHTTDGSKNILFHLHVRKDGVLLKGVFPDSIIETADTDLITGGSFSTKTEKSTCAYASTFADSGIKNITFGVRTTGVDMLEGSRIIITGVDL